MDRFDHRKPGGRLEGFVDETPEVDPKDAPLVTAELVAYMERRLDEMKVTLCTATFVDDSARLRALSQVRQFHATVTHFRVLADNQKNQAHVESAP